MQMEVEMDKRIFFNIHSFIDVITNSSSELYVVDANKITGFAKELFDLFKESFTEGFRSNETTITKFSESDYTDEYLIPKDVNTENLYFIDVDYNDPITHKLIEKYFNIIELQYKED